MITVVTSNTKKMANTVYLFLGLREQTTTNWVASNNTNVLPHSLEARSLKSRCEQDHALCDCSREESFYASFSF